VMPASGNNTNDGAETRTSNRSIGKWNFLNDGFLIELFVLDKFVDENTVIYMIKFFFILSSRIKIYDDFLKNKPLIKNA
jgi:hypothetical protein